MLWHQSLVLNLPPFLAVLPLLGVSLWAHRRGGTVARGRMRGLARVGFGLAKVAILAPPLERFIVAAAQALPAAQTSSVAWLSVFAFAIQLYLVLSGAMDIWLGMRQAAGRRVTESFGAPFRATSFTQLWLAWVPPTLGNGDKVHAPLLSMGAVLTSVAIWRETGWTAALWLGLHALFVALEKWRGRSLFAPLPPPVCGVLCQVTFVFSGVFLFLPTFDQASDHLLRLFLAPAATAYSVLQNARLTTPWPLICLWLGGLASLALPPVRWLLEQKGRGWPVAGLMAGVLAMAFVARELTPLAPESSLALVRHGVQWPLARWFQEGDRHVFVGRDGWLYDQQELDRLTLQGRGGAQQALARFAEELRAQDVPFLVILVPNKTSLYPETILPGEYHGPVRPPSYAVGVEALKAAGAVLYEPAESLWQQKKKRSLYFQRGNHWTPEAMKEVASGGFKLIREKWPQVVADRTPLVNVQILDRQDPGNLARTLDPWAPESLWGEEAAQLVAITGLAEQTDAPVLVLGGALLRVYDDPDLPFGDPQGARQPAGFGTQLAALLRQPVAMGPAIEALSAEARAKLAVAASSRQLVVALVRAGDL